MPDNLNGPEDPDGPDDLATRTGTTIRMGLTTQTAR